jgi:peptidylprolyl isomerase
MPKRKASSTHSILRENHKKQLKKNKKARNEARSIEAIRDNPRAVRDELSRLRILNGKNQLDAPGLQKLQELSAINREFSMAKYAKEQQARQTSTKKSTSSNNSKVRQIKQQHGASQGQAGPIIYRPGGYVPPPPPPRRSNTSATLIPRQSNSTSTLQNERPAKLHSSVHSSVHSSAPSCSFGPSGPNTVSAPLPPSRFQPPPLPPQLPVRQVEGCNGTTYQILKDGVKDGNTITPKSTATLHAIGKVDGIKFWSTRDHGQQPFETTFGVGNVIKGWDYGCLGMKVSEVRRLMIPGHEAYGQHGFPAWGIKPNATLEFVLECLATNGEKMKESTVESSVGSVKGEANGIPPPPPPRRTSVVTEEYNLNYEKDDDGIPPPPPPRGKSIVTEEYNCEKDDDGIPPPPPPRRKTIVTEEYNYEKDDDGIPPPPPPARLKIENTAPPPPPPPPSRIQPAFVPRSLAPSKSAAMKPKTFLKNKLSRATADTVAAQKKGTGDHLLDSFLDSV